MRRLLLGLILFAPTSTACDSDSDRELTLRFAPMVGDQPFACGRDFMGVGSGAATVTPLDFRMYVHEVALLRASGERVAVEILRLAKNRHGHLQPGAHLRARWSSAPRLRGRQRRVHDR